MSSKGILKASQSPVVLPGACAALPPGRQSSLGWAHPCDAGRGADVGSLGLGLAGQCTRDAEGRKRHLLAKAGQEMATAGSANSRGWCLQPCLPPHALSQRSNSN